MEELNIEELPEIVIDEAKVKEAQDAVDKRTAELKTKVYAIGWNKSDLDLFDTIINDVEWKGKEALGILEISKRIDAIIEEGIKNDAVYMTALEVEASHYFLSRYTNKGNTMAKDFLKIYKTLEQTLMGIGQDNKDLESLKTDLAAAQQGLTAV